MANKLEVNLPAANGEQDYAIPTGKKTSIHILPSLRKGKEDYLALFLDE